MVKKVAYYINNREVQCAHMVGNTYLNVVMILPQVHLRNGENLAKEFFGSLSLSRLQGPTIS
jgi:hypothetical protein